MKTVETEAITLTGLTVQIDIEELEKKIKKGFQRPHIREIVRKTLTKVCTVWSPAIIYRWLHCAAIEEGCGTHMMYSRDKSVIIDLGNSSQFLSDSSYVLAAVFTAGNELDAVGRQAGKDGQILVAYIIDVIGLIVLEKTGSLVKNIAEKKAKELGWGVSPLLSPGSNHGWKLEEQLQLCSLLPIGQVGLSIENDAVLRPFKSLSCVIGIGPEYPTAVVGSTCLVCSRNSDCQLKQL